uniref:Uncharacterized protein n=1 Tax=Otus sunia TaxID=257818 RepID=A0A8C8B2H2_9STRI
FCSKQRESQSVVPRLCHGSSERLCHGCATAVPRLPERLCHGSSGRLCHGSSGQLCQGSSQPKAGAHCRTPSCCPAMPEALLQLWPGVDIPSQALSLQFPGNPSHIRSLQHISA